MVFKVLNSAKFTSRVVFMLLVAMLVISPVSLAENKAETTDLVEEVLIIHQEHIAILKKRVPETFASLKVSDLRIDYLMVAPLPLASKRLYLLYQALKVFD